MQRILLPNLAIQMTYLVYSPTKAKRHQTKDETGSCSEVDQTAVAPPHTAPLQTTHVVLGVLPASVLLSCAMLQGTGSTTVPHAVILQISASPSTPLPPLQVYCTNQEEAEAEAEMEAETVFIHGAGAWCIGCSAYLHACEPRRRRSCVCLPNPYRPRGVTPPASPHSGPAIPNR